MGLESILAAIAPTLALRRRIARDALRAYDGAGVGRRMKGWRTNSTSPNAEIAPKLQLLRDRSRDLCRNNPYAARAVDILVGHQIGYGIMPRSNTGNAGIDKRVNALFAAWCAQASLDGRHDFYGLQALVGRSRAESGEALILIQRGAGDGVPLRLQVVEADHLDTTKEDLRPDGSSVRYGVEYDATGRRTGYWLYDQHPGEMSIWSRTSLTSRLHAAKDVLHVFRELRPGQVRGVPDLTPVMTRMRGLDDYQEAELERARVQACLAAFVTSNGSPAQAPLAGAVDAASGERRETLAPGIIYRLQSGEDVKFNAPASNGAYPDHMRSVLHAIAVGFGVTYHQLTGDLRDANYSSLRAGNIEFRRLVEQAQWLTLIPQFCQPVWDAFIAMAELSGRLRPRADGYPVQWVPPAFEAVDPLKDAEAEASRIANRLTSPQRAIAAQGYDPEEILAEHAAWQERLRALGLQPTPAPAPPAPPQQPIEDDNGPSAQPAE